MTDASLADTLIFATGLEQGTFQFIGSDEFDGMGNSQARTTDGLSVEIDRDGDGNRDFHIRMEGLTSPNQITSSDFLWL